MSDTDKQTEQVNDMITPTEAAKILNVSRTTVQRLMDEGRLPAPEKNPLLKRPRRVLLNRADVLALVPPAPADRTEKD